MSIFLLGVSINFVKNDDIRILRDIEQYYSTQIDEMPMNGKQIMMNFHVKAPTLIYAIKTTINMINDLFFSCGSDLEKRESI